MKALILAGGPDARPQTVVADRLKTMAKVAGRPFLQYQVERLRRQGFDRLVFCLGYRAAQVAEYFGDGQDWGVHIEYAVEDEPLGTAGAIRNAQHLLDGPFVLLNGDSFLDADLGQVVAAHQRRAHLSGMAGTLATVFVENASGFGTLLLGHDLRVQSFREKSTARWGWVNAGAYVFQPTLLDYIPAGRAASLEREVLPGLLASGRRLFACPLAGFFVDIGTPEGNSRFQEYAQHCLA